MKRIFKPRRKEKKARRIEFARITRIRRKKTSIIPYLIGISIAIYILYNLDDVINNFSNGFNFLSK